MALSPWAAHFDRKWWARTAVLMSIAGSVALLLFHKPWVTAQSGIGYSLRFYGHGVNDIDRVKIPIDPHVPADVGASDFTLEAWVKATLPQNPSPPCTPGNDNWIYGNILFDRDVWGPGDFGDFGLSLANGRIAFGVHNGTSGTTLCGARLVADGAWHHIALTRRRADGFLRLFVDGQVDVQGDGPDGDVSYRDGRATSYPNDPYLVLGAEKHDARPAYPSYSGWLDEVRLSTVLRYSGAFTPPSQPFTPDPYTAALYHLDEGPEGACTGIVVDSSGAVGGPSPGVCRYGGAPPAGPVYSTDSPFTGSTSTPTPVLSATPTRSLTLTSTPAATPTQTNTPAPTSTSAPPQPCRLSAAKRSSDVVLSWTAAPNATAYRVYRGTTPYFVPSTPYATTTDLTYTDTGVTGDPTMNYSYRVSAVHPTGETLCDNRVGEFDVALTAGSIRGAALNDLAIPLDVSAVITDAEGLANWIEAEGGVPFATVRQLLKWDASRQTFLAWDHRFGFGDNFAIATGDFILMTLNRDAPPVTTFVGRVPEPGEVSFGLSPGAARGCALNFISLPFDQGALTTADQLSDAIGIPDITVIQALDWDATRQNPLVWLNVFGLGNNFPTTPGFPYIVCLSATGVPPVWP